MVICAIGETSSEKADGALGAGVRMDEVGLDIAGVMERRVWFFQTCFARRHPMIWLVGCEKPALTTCRNLIPLSRGNGTSAVLRNS